MTNDEYLIIVISLVGVRKTTVSEAVLTGVPILADLIKNYRVLEISCEGSPEHERAGLSKDKALIKAYNKR